MLPYRAFSSVCLSFLLVFGWISPRPAPPAGQSEPPVPFDAGVWVPDGPVYAIQNDPSSGRTFLGGDFASVNPYTGHLLASGSDDPLAPAPAGFPVLDGPVYAIAGDAVNGWYVGGDFQISGSLPHKNLLRLNPDLSLDTGWTVTVDGPVYAITLYAPLSGAWIYVGGAFQTVNGQPRSNLAALTKSGVLVQNWTPNPDGPVRALLAQGVAQALFVGGAFHHLGGLATNALGAVELTGSGSPTGWVPSPGMDDLAVVEALAVASITSTAPWAVIAGGQFTITPNSGDPITNLAGYSSNGPLAEDLNLAPDGPVHALLVTRENGMPVFYIGGSFTHIAGAQVSGLARVVGSTLQYFTPDLAYNFQLDGAVYTIQGNASEQIIGGSFRQVLGKDQPGLLRLAYSLQNLRFEARDWSPRIQMRQNTVRAALSAGARTLAGGDFFSAGGTRRDHLAALDPDGQVVPEWAAGADGPVRALALNMGRLYLGGQFSRVNSAGVEKPCANAAAVSASGGVLDWCPNPDGPVAALAAYAQDAGGAGAILLGGEFRQVRDPSTGPLERPYLAMVRSDGTVADFAPAPDQPVRALAVQGSLLFAGGAFTRFNGVPAAYAAWLDLTASSAAYPLNPTAPVNALTVSGRQVYLGTGTAEDPFQGRVEAFDWLAPGPAQSDFGGFRGQVQALSADWRWVYTGGTAPSASGGERLPYAAVYNTSTQSVVDLPGLFPARGETDTGVRAIQRSGDRLMAGGYFGGAAGQEHPYFLVLRAPMARFYLPTAAR